MNYNNIISYKFVLEQKFSNGFRLKSPLDIRKFKKYYSDIIKQELTENDDIIKSKISECGIVYNNKVFLVDTLLSFDVKNKLLSYIKKSFESGKKALYFDALFDEFQQDFSCEKIYNAEILKLYLQYILGTSYHFDFDYISQEKSVKINFEEEISKCFIKHGTPVFTETICTELSYIPQDKIRHILSSNDAFIRNSKGEYYHCSLINLTDNDVNCIISIIDNAIKEKSYISGNELIEAVGKKYPHILDNNAVLSQLGLRGAIAYTLRENFSFAGNVISRYGVPLSMAGVYADFSKNRDRFTIDELRLLKSEIQSGVIYFDSVYPNSLRISEGVFVARENACFDTTATDSAIEMFMNNNDYLPLTGITSFGSFPNAGFPWNIFLLEHYVAEFSAKYKLLHTTYNENKCAGVIVRKSSNINTFEEIVSIALADSNIVLTEANALQFLCDSGYIAIRRYKNIAQTLIKANEIRNKKGKNL